MARGLVEEVTRSPSATVDRYVSGLSLWVGRVDPEEGLSRADRVTCGAELRGRTRELRAETDRAAREVEGARRVSLRWDADRAGAR